VSVHRELAAPQPTSSQLHHMISERRRRERLNESFETLRALLPPGSKVVQHNQPLLSLADNCNNTS
jgi:hypothetical protein